MVQQVAVEDRVTSEGVGLGLHQSVTRPMQQRVVPVARPVEVVPRLERNDLEGVYVHVERMNGEPMVVIRPPRWTPDAPLVHLPDFQRPERTLLHGLHLVPGGLSSRKLRGVPDPEIDWVHELNPALVSPWNLDAAQVDEVARPVNLEAAQVWLWPIWGSRNIQEQQVLLNHLLIDALERALVLRVQAAFPSTLFTEDAERALLKVTLLLKFILRFLANLLHFGTRLV
mmetsp:Transcript_133481/g.345542  ORF Transcript_133481/g.345542 Transcript_133481/m.345542 type:complete len:228 (-) Transcript_133481:1099-1782(-)